MGKITIFLILSITLIFVNSCHKELIVERPIYDYSNMNDETIEVHKKVEDFLFLVQEAKYPAAISPSTRIENLVYDEPNKKIEINFSEAFSQIPFREITVDQFYKELKKTLGSDYRDFDVEMRSLKQPIENLVPNYYRQDKNKWDQSRLPKNIENRPLPVVRLKENPHVPEAGLYGKNIALWQSHGWYYNHQQDRWMWQRARLFGTVEDLLPTSFVIPYILPMLENAGANVFVPRERDVQTNEIIIDNDSILVSNNMTSYSENRMKSAKSWLTGDSAGYAVGRPPYPANFNPFASGTYRFTGSDSIQSAFIKWTPAIPDSGFYAVYVSYNHSAQNVDDSHYTVFHSGGKTEFLVNQKIGGGTWIYLGTFKFNSGYNPASGSVMLSNKSREAGRIVSADAVKFGGGVGNVMQNGSSSNRPKFVEGSRYWLQTAGFPDTLVYSLNKNRSDYRDDYQSRGEWVNYLYGAPNGPNKKRDASGMGIPIDVSLAFHTDAGITRNDTTIGTLQIYSVVDADTQTVFPDGMSRYASRDLSDIMQTQIVEDIRKLFDPVWSRRALYEAQYSEAFRPNTAATLLELLSHQNYLDMKFALDPRFRFHASRAIYKGILRFVSAQFQSHYVVQPLPITHFSAVFDSSGNIELNWEPQSDPLEPTAEASSYKVYMRKDDGGFDNGIMVQANNYILPKPEKNVIYSFKVTAINDGGESFDSEILSACLTTNPDNPVLVVNGFDRVAPPATIEKDEFLGFAYFLDNGVPDKYDLNYVGEQFNYDGSNKWRTDDRPGHGASWANYETKVIAGNTFDYPYIHGKSIRDAGYAFVSCSDEAVMDENVYLNDYSMVDLIMGEEKETGWQKSVMDSVKGTDFKTFPEKLKRAIRTYLGQGGALFLSGAYIASDLFENTDDIYPDVLFAREALHYNWVSNHAVKTGHVFASNDTTVQLPEDFEFNTEFDRHMYRVEAPDAIGPINGSRTILRYRENGFSAGVAFDGDYKIVALGFPYETIKSSHKRGQIMKGILSFFNKED